MNDQPDRITNLVDQKCKLSIRTDGATDTFARFQFWTVAVALTGVCVRSGQIGTRNHLGKSHQVGGKKRLMCATTGLRDHLTMEIGPA